MMGTLVVTGLAHLSLGSEADLELSRTSRWRFFVKIVNGLLAVNYFRKKAPPYMFNWALNRPLRLFL